ncbi:unnamed protein product [Effrenium voratum]|uniref:Uncharacterized protein n=1 Tax=Effrenium voratum TaxID=2562239 RepID=A0AA36IDQ3_9DINO|nr:unnamed protein product [Effrenium voratum]
MSAEVAPCWKTLDGLDVARLFEEKVAMTVADNMKAPVELRRIRKLRARTYSPAVTQQGTPGAD